MDEIKKERRKMKKQGRKEGNIRGKKNIYRWK
jgi:hypothetical protein